MNFKLARIFLLLSLLTYCLIDLSMPAFTGAQITSLSPQASFIGEAVNNVFGISVASAGDVNHDGWQEFLVGSSFSQGKAYLYSLNYRVYNTSDAFIIPILHLFQFLSCKSKAG